MAVDTDKVRKKIEEEKARAAARSGGNAGFKLWKPKVGKNKIRIMPPWEEDPENSVNAGQFWREIYRHWNVGEGGYDEEGRGFTCPLKTPDGNSDTCPVCELVDELRASGDPYDSEVAKEIRAKQRVWSNIVDYKDPVYTEEDVEEWAANTGKDEDDCPFEEGDTKIQMWGYGPTLFKELLDYFGEADLSDLETGRDLTITREGTGLNTKYRTKISLEEKPFEVEGDLEKLLPNLDNFMPFPEIEDMAAALKGEVRNNSSSSKEVESAPERKKLSTSKRKPKNKKKKTKEPSLEDVIEEAGEDPPECFRDGESRDSEDPECVGGVDDDGFEFEACPFYTLCEVKEEKPKKKRKKRKAKKTPSEDDSEDSEDLGDLEAEIKRSLSE